MYKKANTLTGAEQARIDEITFCNFIDYLFKINSNPTKVYAFIEVVCTLAQCDLLVLNSVVGICMTQDRRYKSTKEEYVHLLARSGTSVRKTVAHLSISQRDYYEILYQDPPDIKPKFTTKQYIEITKFISCLTNIIPERIV